MTLEGIRLVCREEIGVQGGPDERQLVGVLMTLQCARTKHKTSEAEDYDGGYEE